MTRPAMTKEEIKSAFKACKNQMYEALNEKGNGAFISKHEIYGFLAEEVKELLDAIHADLDDNNESVKEELLDIAVVAIFAHACIDSGHVD